MEGSCFVVFESEPQLASLRRILELAVLNIEQERERRWEKTIDEWEQKLSKFWSRWYHYGFSFEKVPRSDVEEFLKDGKNFSTFCSPILINMSRFREDEDNFQTLLNSISGGESKLIVRAQIYEKAKRWALGEP